MQSLILIAVGLAAPSVADPALVPLPAQARAADTVIVVQPVRRRTLADDDLRGDLNAHRGPYLDHDLRDDDPRADLRSRHGSRRATADDLRRDQRDALRDAPQTVTPEEEAAAAVESEPVAPPDAG